MVSPQEAESPSSGGQPLDGPLSHIDVAPDTSDDAGVMSIDENQTKGADSDTEGYSADASEFTPTATISDAGDVIVAQDYESQNMMLAAAEPDPSAASKNARRAKVVRRLTKYLRSRLRLGIEGRAHFPALI